jgi:hypothetical protein
MLNWERSQLTTNFGNPQLAVPPLRRHLPVLGFPNLAVQLRISEVGQDQDRSIANVRNPAPARSRINRFPKWGIGWIADVVKVDDKFVAKVRGQFSINCGNPQSAKNPPARKRKGGGTCPARRGAVAGAAAAESKAAR